MTEDFPPSPYTDWVLWLNGFAQGEDAEPARPLLQPGNLKLGSYASDRVLARFAAALQARVVLWQDRFLADVKALLEGRGGSLGPVLIDARNRLGPLRAAANHPLLPAALREQNSARIEEFVDETQRQFESALRELRDGGALLALARSTPLNAKVPVSADQS